MQEYHRAFRDADNQAQAKIRAGKFGGRQWDQMHADDAMKELQKRMPQGINYSRIDL
jgi:hypothetical protein